MSFWYSPLGLFNNIFHELQFTKPDLKLPSRT